MTYVEKNKPKTFTDYEQCPNLIKELTDQAGVLLTDIITYIPVQHDWAYLASVYNLITRQIVAYKVSDQMTK